MLFDHVSLYAGDFAATRDFFVAALEPFDAAIVAGGDNWAMFAGGDGDGRFVLAQGGADAAPAHLAFAAKTRDQVRRFHAAALAAGGRDNGAPGLRAHYGPTYYAAFVLDPHGNNVEAVCRAAGD